MESSFSGGGDCSGGYSGGGGGGDTSNSFSGFDASGLGHVQCHSPVATACDVGTNYDPAMYYVPSYTAIALSSSKPTNHKPKTAYNQNSASFFQSRKEKPQDTLAGYEPPKKNRCCNLV